jgi:hypothetical protein
MRMGVDMTKWERRVRLAIVVVFAYAVAAAIAVQAWS